MTDQRLTTLLNDLADDVDTDEWPGAVELAPAAWQVAGQRRRSRRLTGAAMVSAAAVVAGFAVVLSPGGPPSPRPTATPAASVTSTPSAPGPVQLAPARSAEAALPFVDVARSALPRTIDLSAAAVLAAPLLTASPVTRALALMEHYQEGPTPGPVVVIGADGRVRRLGVALAWIADSGGNKQLPLGSGSLSPDGTRAAFAQKDQVLVVDLSTSQVRHLPVPGFNETVSWSPSSRQLLVTSETGSSVLDVASATVVSSSSTVQLVLPADGRPATLGAIPYLDSYWGEAFASGSRVEVGGFSSGLQVEGAPTVDPQILAVVDSGHPQDARLLAFDWDGRYKGCCAALGWLGSGEDTVLMTSEGGHDPLRILAWNLVTATVERVSEVTNGSVVSLALR